MALALVEFAFSWEVLVNYYNDNDADCCEWLATALEQPTKPEDER